MARGTCSKPHPQCQDGDADTACSKTDEIQGLQVSEHLSMRLSPHNCHCGRGTAATIQPLQPWRSAGAGASMAFPKRSPSHVPSRGPAGLGFPVS